MLGRNVTRLVQLAPGAALPTGWLNLHPENASETFTFQINGQIGGNSNYQIDGVSQNESIQGLAMMVPTADSVQEMKVTTSGYDAEFSQVAGAVIQVSSKGGTNQYHGSAFEFYRSNGMFARDPFTEPVRARSYVWHQFGGSMGGPIVKDKLFFFGDYQGERNRLALSGVSTSPVAAFRAGDFSAIAATNPIFDPLTGNADGTGRQQFSCNGALNVICANRISPAAKNVLALLDSPTNPSLYDNNFVVARSAIYDKNQYNGRIDYNKSSRTTIFGRYSLFRSFFNTPTFFGEIAGGRPLGGIPNSGVSPTQTQNFSGAYSVIMSPTFFAEVRGGYSRLRIDSHDQSYGINVADQVGIPGININQYSSGLPSINIGGPVSTFFVGTVNSPFIERETNINLVSNWTKINGRHTFKWGVTFEKAFTLRNDSGGGQGSFTFSQNVTGSPSVTNSGLGMASFLLGLSSGYSRRALVLITQEKQWRDGAYFQDTWNVTPKFTLNLGLRWNYISPIFAGEEQPGHITNLDTTTGEVLLGNLFDKYAGVKPIYDEFEPRLGLAYRLTDKTVLRAGFARSHALNSGGANFGTQAATYPNRPTQNFTPPFTFAPISFTLDQGPSAPAPIPPLPANGRLPLPNGIMVFGLGTDLPHTYLDSWNLTVQHQLAGNVTLEGAYVGNVSRHVWDPYNINVAVPGPGPLDPRREYFAKFGWTQVLQLRVNDLNANFHSFQGRVEKNFSQGLWAYTTFTWGKSLRPAIVNPFCRGCYRGPSGRDTVSVSGFSYELPFGRGKKLGGSASGFANQVIGGWNLNGIVNLQSGVHFSPGLNQNAFLNSDCCTPRPNRVGEGTVANPTRDKWFDVAAFTVPGQYTQGNSGTGILEGPGVASTDLGLFKSFRISERMNFQFRWELFNAFNRTNLNNPNTAVDANPQVAATITSIIGTIPMRRMQIGGRLAW